MKNYSLSIITPQGEIFSGQVSALTAPGEYGRVGVLADHAPMIMALKRGIMSITTEDEIRNIVLEPGVLEVKPGHDVLVLVEGAKSASIKDEGLEI